MNEVDAPTILLVDDDPQVLSLFQSVLERDYDVVTADSGEAALDVFDEHVDACIIDRRMQGLTGGDVVQQLREEGFDQPIAMVTAVEPDFDVLDLGFDDYVVKPVSPNDLRNLVESLVLRRRYDEVLREYFSLASKVTALRGTKSPNELAAHDNYGNVVDNLNLIKQEAKHSLEAAIDAGLLEDLVWESFVEGEEAGLAEFG